MPEMLTAAQQRYVESLGWRLDGIRWICTYWHVPRCDCAPRQMRCNGSTGRLPSGLLRHIRRENSR